MGHIIRKINESEYSVLDDFLYEAIFIPDGVEAPPREIIEQPELRLYTEDFGKHEGDCCFVAEVCGRDWVELSEVQKNAVLCFWYDSEMNSGGFSGYIDCYPDTDPAELENALLTVGNRAFADNYRKAVSEGEDDDWAETDDAYYGFSPSLSELLQEYVEEHRDVIFD